MTNLLRFLFRERHLIYKFHAYKYQQINLVNLKNFYSNDSRSTKIFVNEVGNIIENKNNNDKDDVKFGDKSRYVDLDNKSSKLLSIADSRTKMYSNKYNDDRFGTLNDGDDNLAFKKKVSKLIKPDSDMVFPHDVEEEDESEIEPLKPSHDEEKNRNYALKLRQLHENNRSQEAISFFFQEIIAKERIKPSLKLYSLMIKICSNSGNCEIAFGLFEQINQSGEASFRSNVMYAIMTTLFLACAKSSKKEYGVEKIKSLREFMRENGAIPNVINYAAMINAFGSKKAIDEAFKVLDDMKNNNVKPDEGIFSNLLFVCNYQEIGGFKKALKVWQMMLQNKLRPNVTHYSLLLRAAKYCTFDESMNSFKRNQKIRITAKNSTESDTVSIDNKNNKQIDAKQQHDFDIKRDSHVKNDKISSNIATSSNDSSSIIQLTNEQVKVIDEVKLVGEEIEKKVQELEWWQKLDNGKNINKADLLKPLAEFKPELKEKLEIISFKNFLTDATAQKLDETALVNDTPADRLLALGNIKGVYKAMKFHRVKPEFKIFKYLMETAPYDTQPEIDLLKALDGFKYEIDIHICNNLLLRQVSRNDKLAIQNTLSIIQERKLIPNRKTFGILAGNVYTVDQLRNYLSDMEHFGIELNILKIHTLSRKGILTYSMAFMDYLFDYIETNNIKVTNVFIDEIKTRLDVIKLEIIEIERKYRNLNSQYMPPKTYYKYTKSNQFYAEFKEYFDKWTKRNKNLIVKDHLYVIERDDSL